MLGFTDHARDLEMDGVTYKAASAYTRTAIRSTADLAVDNLDLESVSANEGITDEDLRAGRYDFAEVPTFLVNYENLTQASSSCGTAGLAIYLGEQSTPPG